MADDKPAFIQQLLSFWQSLSRVRKVALVAIMGLVVLGVLTISILGSSIRYSPLYRGLSPEDAGLVLTKLKDLKIPTRVTAGDIEVPEERVHELRLELASQGLPRGGGIGFEIFDKAELGTTQFEQQVKLRRALEGELGRSISTLEGVQGARVHLVIPENRLFMARSESASASVVVKLRPGYNFGAREVAGIVHLVSSAVPGLSRERLSVVSTDGRTLHSPGEEGDEGTAGVNATRSQQETQISRIMEDKVRTLLERVTGFGGVDVRVHVQLEDESRERTEERYNPTNTALRSEHKTSETTNQEGASVAGVPGAQSNLPDVEASAAAREAEADGSIFRKSQTRNWEIDRTTERIKTPPGAIDRITVAVLIDGLYEDKEGVQVFSPRSAEELRSLEAIARNAVGFDETRGDTIRIESARFKKVDEGDLDHQSLFDRYKHLLPYVLGVLGLLTLLVVFLVFMRSLRNHERRLEEAAKAAAAAELAAAAVAAGTEPGSEPTPTPSDGEPPSVEGTAVQPALAGPDDARALEAADGDASAASELEGSDHEGQEPEEDEMGAKLPEPEVLEEQRKRALELAASSPATAALVLAAWLNDSLEAQPATPGEGGTGEAATAQAEEEA